MPQITTQRIRSWAGAMFRVRRTQSVSWQVDYPFDLPGGDHLSLEVIRRGCLFDDPVGPWVVVWTDNMDFLTPDTEFFGFALHLAPKYDKNITVDGSRIMMRCQEKHIGNACSMIGTLVMECAYRALERSMSEDTDGE